MIKHLFTDMIDHSFVDCDFSFNKNGGMIYRSSNNVPTRHTIHIDRCQFTNSDASISMNDQEKYALTLHIQNSDFVIENCLFQDNIGLGGISIVFDDSDASIMQSGVGNVLNCQFARNSLGVEMIKIAQHFRSSFSGEFPYVTIEGNAFTENALDTFSVIQVNEVYCDINFNTIFDNHAGRVISIRQTNLPMRAQECSSNLIIYNVAQITNEKYSIEIESNGLQLHNNVIQNPATDYEINAISGEEIESGSDILNATNNWWGTTSVKRIYDKFRDSDHVIGYASVVFEPYLLSPPSDIQSSKYIAPCCSVCVQLYKREKIFFSNTRGLLWTALPILIQSYW